MNAWWQDTWTLLSHPLMAPLAFSAAAGLLAYTCARGLPWLARLLGLAAAIGTVVLTGRLFVLSDVPAFHLTWLAVEGFSLNIALSWQPFGGLVAIGAALFALGIAIYALASEHGQRDEGRFHALLCWTLTGAIGAALADDLLWLLICWELVSLALYLLLNLGTGTAAAGAAKTFGLVGLGDAALLLAVVLLGATQGTFQISQLDVQVGTPLMYLVYLLFVAAALAKAGAVPMHSWIPAAASDASVATFALLPASIDKLLGIYLLARFSLGVFELDGAMRVVLMIIGAVTILAAVFMAMLQHRLKKLLSFHAVSQVGYMVLGIGTGTPIGIIGGVFHMLNHAIYKACLFLTAGNVERTAGTDELNRLGGLARALPLTFVGGAVAALAISGVPPLNGFVSKWLVYQGCLAEGSPLALLCLVAAVFGSALTLASFFKVIATVFWGPLPHEIHTEPAPARLARATPIAVLAALCIAFGVAAQWPLQQLILPAVADYGVIPELQATAAHLDTGALGLWAAGPATMLIVLGLLGGALLYLLTRALRVRVADVFVGGEQPASLPSLKYPATSFYRTIEELPGLRGALRDGQQSAYDIYRLGGQYGGSLVQLLRNQHTGVLSVYVSWCLVGVVLIVVYLMAAT